MLRSDCSRHNGRHHCYVLNRTTHQGVGLINQVCHVVNDGEKNSSLEMNLACLSNAAHQEKPLRFALQSSRHSKRRSMIRLVASQSDVWRTEHFQWSKLLSQHLLKISKFKFIVAGSTSRTPRTDIRCTLIWYRTVVHSTFHVAWYDMEKCRYIQLRNKQFGRIVDITLPRWYLHVTISITKPCSESVQ